MPTTLASTSISSTSKHNHQLDSSSLNTNIKQQASNAPMSSLLTSPSSQDQQQAHASDALSFIDKLPSNVKFELDQLELELLEGDITQKGYEKKKAKLLAPYMSTSAVDQQTINSVKSNESGSTTNETSVPIKLREQRHKKGVSNKDDPNANRYHSEIRQEAVKAALAMYSNQKQSVILSSKRNTTYLAPINATSATNKNDNDQVNPFPVASSHQNKPTKNAILYSDDEEDEEISTGGSDELINDIDNDENENMNHLDQINSKYNNNKKSNSSRQKRQQTTTPDKTVANNSNTNSSGRGGSETGAGGATTTTTTTSGDDSSANSSKNNTASNVHVNQFYYHAQQLQQEIKSSQINTKQNQMQLAQSDLMNNDRNQNMNTKADRMVVQIKNKSINQNNSKIKSSPSTKLVASTNSSTSSASPKLNTKTAHLTQQVSTISLNQSNENENINDASSVTRHPTRVSAKIQQLLNTLKRPKRRPLNEYFEDNQEEVAIPPLDPQVPKPESGTSVPACGEPLVVPASFPQSIEAAIHKFANASSKTTCISVLDQAGKPISSLTYVKLLNRAQKIAYHLLNKFVINSVVSSSINSNGLSTNTNGSSSSSHHHHHNSEPTTLKLGDRVALVFPNNDPIGFTTAFCACLIAGLVALPIDVPLARRDAGSQNLGFLLGQVGASIVLTSELCFKAFSKNQHEVIEFKGWPRIPWIVIESLNKSPPKDWAPPNRLASDSIAYIEYSTLKDGSVTGVAVTREEMLCHCQTLHSACQYSEGEYVVCVLDYKREFGLWHGIQSCLFNGMHMIYVPYSIMKVNPAIWLTTITKYKASVALVKSRDMHWGLMAQRDHKDINLSSLRILLVADGANPWSLSSCDTFLDVFQAKGLRPESICPSAGSSETLTISIRRPNRSGPQSSGRGVLSMSGLSYGVVRVDQENSLTSLTLQDVGQVLPGTLVGVIKLNNNQNSSTPSTTTTTGTNGSATQTLSSNLPTLCQTDEIGEICISSRSTADRYFDLPGLTTNVFKIIPHGSDQKPIGSHEFVRSGLLGFLGPSGLVFVCGSREGLIEVSGRRHNTDDIIATVLAVEPMKFIYRGRIAVFSIKVLKDERIIIVAEQRPDASEEECFQWMSRVLQAVDSIHHVGVYCLALVPPNTLPKTPLGGIHIPETKSRFLDGSLHPSNILMCPHTCVLNLPKPREHHPEREVGPSAVLAGSIVQGRRLAEAKGRDIFDDESDTAKKYQFLGDILRWRSATNPDHVLYTLINSKGQEIQKLTCSQLHKKAEKVACLLVEKAQLVSGDHVALIFPPSADLVIAFYACLYVGLIPVPIRPPHIQNIQTTLPTIKMIIEMSRIKAILSIGSLIKLFKSKDANTIVDSRQWPILLDIDENTKKKLSSFFRPASGDRLCYLDFSVSTTGMLAGIQINHSTTTALCRAIKLSCELYPSREVVLCLDPYSGLGFALWCLNSVYSGHHSILVPPVEVELNPCIWLATVSHFKVRDTFCSYSVMELCTKGLRSSVIDLKQNNSLTGPNSSSSTGSSTLSLSKFSFIDTNNSGTLLKHYLKSRGINLSCVRTCAIVAEERPRIQLTSSFTKLFQSLGLPARAVSTTFGCRANIAVCLQGASDPDPTPVYVDQRALRNDRVTIVEKGSPHSLCLLESGKLLPGVKVVIANPETKGQCADSHLGEIWVQSPHNSNSYYNIYGQQDGDAEQQEQLQNDHFNCHLATGDTTTAYARTGYLGFVRRIESEMSMNNEPHDAIYIVGSLDETLMIKGMRYHPIDIETTVLRSHKKICECACFTWTNLLVVVVELDGQENEALDLVPLVTNSVLENHYLIVGVVVVVDPGVVPINSRGEKQRMHLRDGFLSDLLDPIYVAYNM